MWRRVYLLLLLVRVYFALSPSYLHPDEIFQGPEVIAGYLFPYPSVRTWEWTVDKPIRSVFPLWPAYGLPMALMKSVWAFEASDMVSPTVIYYSLRLVMLALTFVLEDWAIYELVHSPRRRKEVVTLVASSYVTWTFQTHTFSNSLETLLVLWSLVLMERIAYATSQTNSPKTAGLTSEIVSRSSYFAANMVLGFLLVLGTFNRITFPAFVLIPGLQLLPHLWKRPSAVFALLYSVLFWTFVAVATDTAFYIGPTATTSFRALFEHLRTVPIITPLNNVLYNTQTSNLAQHGLHPHYQHILINLPQLLGPALILLLNHPPTFDNANMRAALQNSPLVSALSGILILSIIPHQEPRFLLPCIPLLLTCVRFPESTGKRRRTFWTSWFMFNAAMSILMGIYHQGGIIPAQLEMPRLVTQSLTDSASTAPNIQVYWWKTYPPPTFMLGANHTNPSTNKPLLFTTTPLLGLPQSNLTETISPALSPCDSEQNILDKVAGAILASDPTEVFFAAPLAAWRFQSDISVPRISNFTFELDGKLRLTHLYTHRSHINLDDMDFGDDGVVSTLTRVVGRKGLGVWRVERICQA